MFTLNEITRLVPITVPFIPTLDPFVLAYRFYFGDANKDIAAFWTGTFNVSVPPKNRTVITSVVYDSDQPYSKKNTLIDLLGDDEAFFWDNANQILYIHTTMDVVINQFNPNFVYGVFTGVSDDQVRYYEGNIYRPYLTGFPQIETSVDKFNYDKLSFLTDSLVYDNKDGFFNQFKTSSIYGNSVAIKTGEDGDTYAELIDRAVYFVEDYDFSNIEFTLAVQDVRKTLSINLPDESLNVVDYPNVDENNIGKPICLGYGPLHDVPGLCINGAAISVSVSPDFIFVKEITGTTLADIDVYVLNDDVWVEQLTGVTVNWTTGVVTVDGAKKLTGSTYGPLQVKADVVGTANTYASDIIKHMNDTYINIAYDASNYNLTDWAIEEAFLAPIALYLDTPKGIFEWIKDIQSLSTAGFRYTTDPDGKRTIRVDNPNRTITKTIQNINVKNPDRVRAEANKDDIYNKIYIGYNKSIVNDTATQIKDISYFETSYIEYKIEKVYDKVSGLVTEADAIDKASIHGDDFYKIRRVYEIELIGKQFLDLQLYDILSVYLNKDELVRGQIISIKPNYALETNTIRLRQRDYSIPWEAVYGV